MSHSREEIINKRIEKLSEEDFDLDAWKETTHAVIRKYLMPDDLRLKQISELKVDYGSWALRDATSRYNPLESAKKKGKEILESILDEENDVDIMVLLASSLSEDTMKKIHSGAKKESLIKALKKEKKESLASALAQLIQQNL